ncbi:MAG: aspartate-semialdehyde dehydrogenase, partial [Dehalococcoidia bacterium]
ATPNCSTVPLVLTLAPLLQGRQVTRVIADTYQSVSGAGAATMIELRRQTAAVLAGEPVTIEKFPKQIAFNAIPHVDNFLEDGYTKEEWKMLAESRKILHQPALPLSATCVRIPTLVSHAVAVHADFAPPLSAAEARALWEQQPGLTVLDDPLHNGYPTPLDCESQDAVFVGRARQDTSNPNGLAFWCVTDNLRKGAALNIIQMVEWMQADGCL